MRSVSHLWKSGEEMEFLEYILASATISTLLIAALGWATKSVISERLKNAIKNEYDEKLATHKAELKAQSDVEIEKLKSDLSISAFEHQVKFTNLHEKQAEIVANTYGLLKDFHAKLGDYVAIFEPIGVKSKEERRRITADSHREFIEFYSKNQIYLSKTAVALVDKINDQCKGIFFEFLYGIENNPSNSDTQKWLELSKGVKDEIPKALNELEDEFRSILGSNG
jgi:SHS2 domain-containing protein